MSSSTAAEMAGRVFTNLEQHGASKALWKSIWSDLYEFDIDHYQMLDYVDEEILIKWGLARYDPREDCIVFANAKGKL